MTFVMNDSENKCHTACFGKEKAIEWMPRHNCFLITVIPAIRFYGFKNYDFFICHTFMKNLHSMLSAMMRASVPHALIEEEEL